MNHIPKNTLSPLIEATNDYIILLMYAPGEAQVFFNVEKIKVLFHWPAFYQQLITLYYPTEKLSSHQLSKVSYYLDLVASFMSFHGSKLDDKYLESVGFFFEKYKNEIGSRDREQLFWRAFPEASLRQASGMNR